MAAVIAVATGTADAQAFTGATELHGYSVHESAGTPAVASLVIRDGTSTAGTALVHIELAANAAETVRLPSIDVQTGLFIDRTAGETELTLYVS